MKTASSATLRTKTCKWRELFLLNSLSQSKMQSAMDLCSQEPDTAKKGLQVSASLSIYFFSSHMWTRRILVAKSTTIRDKTQNTWFQVSSRNWCLNGAETRPS